LLVSSSYLKKTIIIIFLLRWHQSSRAAETRWTKSQSKWNFL